MLHQKALRSDETSGKVATHNLNMNIEWFSYIPIMSLLINKLGENLFTIEKKNLGNASFVSSLDAKTLLLNIPHPRIARHREMKFERNSKLLAGQL